MVFIAAGAAAGAWSAASPKLAAIVMFQGLHGVVDEAIEKGERDGRQLAEGLSEMFLDLLRARRSHAG
jgi:hypothetical protein